MSKLIDSKGFAFRTHITLAMLRFTILQTEIKCPGWYTERPLGCNGCIFLSEAKAISKVVAMYFQASKDHTRTRALCQ